MLLEGKNRLGLRKPWLSTTLRTTEKTLLRPRNVFKARTKGAIVRLRGL